MNSGLLNLAAVRPWWLRLMLLLIFASPLVSPTALHPRPHLDHAFRDLIGWCGYAVFVWLLVGLNVGLQRTTNWVATAGIFGLTVALTGAAMRKLKVWEAIQHIVESVAGTQASLEQAELDLVFRLLFIMAALPMFFLALHSFPAGDILRRAARPGRKRRGELWLGLAIFLRVFQHVFEVAAGMMLAWSEENPGLVLPRFRGDWETGLLARVKGGFGWVASAVWVWSLGLIQQGLLFVPVVVRGWAKLVNAPD